MEIVSFGRWQVNCDREATRHAYERVAVGGPETCGCCHCRNFAAARAQIYPAPALALFERLGIDPRREVEVYQMHRFEDGLHYYGGWFHFVGSIIAGEDAVDASARVKLEQINERFSMAFSARTNLVGDAFKGLPLVELGFNAHVPWVLLEPEHA